MSASAAPPVRTGTGRVWRTVAAVLAAAVGAGGLAACSEDPVDPEAGPAAAEVQVLEDRLTEVEDRLAELADRVGVLEDAPVAGEQAEEDGAAEDEPGVLGDGEALIGQGVTVRGEVAEPITTAGVGASFRIAGESGEPIVVVMATPPAELRVDDTVEVTGTVVRIAEESFEIDFGIAADQLFEDPAAFFADFGGEVAISADGMEILPDQAD